MQGPLSFAQLGYAPLVALQAGQTGATPLFCVPGAGAGVVCFADLAESLGCRLPVYGFQPRGLDGCQVPHASVTVMVDCYLAALEAAFPRGPIHLLGHSFGGWFAFELAQRLRGAGRDIASLSLVDSEAPEEGAPLRCSDPEVLRKWVEIIDLTLERPLGVDLAELERLPAAGQLALLHEKLAPFGLVPRKASPDVLRGPIQAFAAAMRAPYWPGGRHSGVLRLAQADDPHDRSGRETRGQGWSRWADRIEVFRAPGNHMTMLRQPHARALAAWVRAAINH